MRRQFSVRLFLPADVAQLARASPCHGEGREFESRHPLHFYYPEQLIELFFGSDSYSFKSVTML